MGKRKQILRPARSLTINSWRLGIKILERLLDTRGIKLHRVTGKRSWSTATGIYWNPRRGLDELLHEAAHVALNHSDYTVPVKYRVVQEQEAWLWAESACHLWGLPFRYGMANRCFATYTHYVEGAGSWRIRWRHRGRN